MGILEKLEMLDLTEEEKAKAKGKFLATLALVTDSELKDTVDCLSESGVKITKAREIKVVGNPKDEIAKKFSILGEINETDIYRENPTLINHNVIDIYKKVKYCNQLGRPYKKEDGTYEPFLFNESLWQKEFNRDFGEEVKATPEVVETQSVDSAPVAEVVEESTAASVGNETFTYEDPIPSEGLDNHMDIKEYMKSTNEMAEIEARTTNFATVRKELEDSLAELDALKNLNSESFDEISFDDLEPDSFGGRAA